MATFTPNGQGSCVNGPSPSHQVSNNNTTTDTILLRTNEVDLYFYGPNDYVHLSADVVDGNGNAIISGAIDINSQNDSANPGSMIFTDLPMSDTAVVTITVTNTDPNQGMSTQGTYAQFDAYT